MSTVKALLLLVCLALAGCAAQPRKATEESLPLSPVKRRIVAVASNEWHYFGRQEVVYQAQEESIPHVGIWEDDDQAHSNRISRYWEAVNQPGITGRDCQQPWSAAFISWVMAAAGVPQDQFMPSQAHWIYLSYLIRRSAAPVSGFIPRTIDAYRPRPGDLICAGRGYAAMLLLRYPTRWTLLEQAPLHCDIVVARTGDRLEAIGGNVRNSVSKSILTLDQDGYLQPTAGRPWFLVLENRL